MLWDLSANAITWLTFGGIAAFALVGAALIFWDEARTTLKWRRAAGRLGLGLETRGPSRSIPGVIHGRLEGLRVEVAEVQEADGHHLRTCVSILEVPGTKGVILRPETLGEKVAKLRVGEDLRTGDAEFDGAVLVAGDPFVAAALLGAEQRVRLAALLAGWDVRLSEGNLVLARRGRVRDPGWIVAAVGRVLEAARLLRCPPERLVARAIEIVRTDPLPEVRRRTLRALLWQHPEDPRTAALCRDLCAAGDPELRLAAARQLGEEGWAELDRLVADRRAPAEVRVRALRALVNTAPSRRQAVSLEMALVTACAPVAEFAVDVMERRRIRPALAPLVASLASADWPPEADAALLPVLARALGATGDAGAEPRLLGLLQRPEEVVRRAAARALAQVGGLRAVEPLLAARAAARPVLDGALRDELEAAVRSIQARLGGAEAGRLSVAGAGGSDAGALSVAAEGGLLSRVEEPAGRDAAETGEADGAARDREERQRRGPEAGGRSPALPG